MGGAGFRGVLLRLRSRWAATLALATLIAGCAAPGVPPADDLACLGPPGPVPGAAATFPLRVQPNRRQLVDAAGRPFLVVGDAAWSLLAQLSEPDAQAYLRDRSERGFTTVLVNLLEHKFAIRAPADLDGDPPFLVPGDFATPNERYFAHVDRVLELARRLNLLVLLAPAYLGNGGGDEGWYAVMRANGPDKLRAFGRYVGRRYRSYPNIVWVQAGDFDPPERDLVTAVAEGIAAEDPAALQTAHGARGSTALDRWAGAAWLSFSTVYGGDIYALSVQHYERSTLPFVAIEGIYEDESGATPALIRAQAYQAVLGGAAGHVFGNNPIWHFDGPGIYTPPRPWRQALASEGARDMTVWTSLLTRLPWWRLRPDRRAELVTDPSGEGADQVVAALACDRSFGMVYVPAGREIEVDPAKLAGGNAELVWYDPGTGRMIGTAIERSTARFRVRAPDPPGDRVLVLRGVRAPAQPPG